MDLIGVDAVTVAHDRIAFDDRSLSGMAETDEQPDLTKPGVGFEILLQLRDQVPIRSAMTRPTEPKLGGQHGPEFLEHDALLRGWSFENNSAYLR